MKQLIKNVSIVFLGLAEVSTVKAVNPCDEEPCDPAATCSVWDGQAECECPDTHMGDGLKIGSGCTLLHPCDQPNRGGCMFPATCNRVGAGHTCICPFGYVDYNEDGSYCEWFPCSTISRGYDCVENSRCIDGFGDDGNVNAFVRDCMCKPGYSGDGRVSCTAQPIDGAYGAWGQWGTCSKSCGTGSQTRTRACNNPAPEHGGKDCSSQGNSTETVDCNTSACPIDGGFTEWGSWGACSTTCGAGLKSASRTCTNPAPSNGGADCVGDLTTTASCNLKSCAGVTMECNDDNTLTVNVESEVSGSILSVAYGSCSKDVISGANVTDQTKWSLTLEPSRCDMEGNLRTLKYNQTAEIVVGRQAGAQQLVFNTYKVDSYCQYTAEYTVTYTYSSVSANEYEFTDSGGVLGLNFFIESMNEHFNETTANSQTAGSTIYLSLKLNSTVNDDFDNAASASASSGKLFVPKACNVKDGSNNTFTLFDTDAEMCTNDIIDLRVSAKQLGKDGSQEWNFSHILFLIDDQNASTYTLSCTVIVCDASRSDDCKRAGDCLDDSYVV